MNVVDGSGLGLLSQFTATQVLLHVTCRSRESEIEVSRAEYLRSNYFSSTGCHFSGDKQKERDIPRSYWWSTRRRRSGRWKRRTTPRRHVSELGCRHCTAFPAGNTESSGAVFSLHFILPGRTCRLSFPSPVSSLFQVFLTNKETSGGYTITLSNALGSDVFFFACGAFLESGTAYYARHQRTW